MATVDIHPLPAWARKLPKRMRPGHSPIFSDGAPTQGDRELACELFEALDPESQDWYGGPAFIARLRQHGAHS